jgi:flagellar biosynthesis/type III secretory pathway protein FliH
MQSATVLDGFKPGSVSGIASGPGQAISGDERQILTQEFESQKAEITQVYNTLHGLVVKLNDLYEKSASEIKEKVPALAVEIARKILVDKTKKGDYQIASIVQAAVAKAPTRQDLVVHVNPEDYSQCQKIQESEVGTLDGISFVSDPSVGRAECMIETPKGNVESFIEKQLEQISEALSKAE